MLTELFGRQRGRCAYCRESFNSVGGYQLDHIVPRVRGGSDEQVNLQLLCGYCNALKSGRAPREFRIYFARWQREFPSAGRVRGAFGNQKFPGRAQGYLVAQLLWRRKPFFWYDSPQQNFVVVWADEICGWVERTRWFWFRAVFPRLRHMSARPVSDPNPEQLRLIARQRLAREAARRKLWNVAWWLRDQPVSWCNAPKRGVVVLLAKGGVQFEEPRARWRSFEAGFRGQLKLIGCRKPLPA